MKKRWLIVLLVAILMISGCSQENGEGYGTAFEKKYLDSFDTVISVILHEQDEETAEEHFEWIHNRFIELHYMFTIYDPWEDGNNMYTINEKAGIEPVEVTPEIMNLLKDAKDWYETYSHKTDITIGPVTAVWSDYRDGHVQGPDVVEEMDESAEPQLPPMEELEAANAFVGMEHLVLDEENMTAYLDDENAKLDVGAVAKGYATEIVAKEAYEKGITSGLISAGGNVKIIGPPNDGGRSKWGVGIENPNASERAAGDPIKEAIFAEDGAFVTSGDYQRFYIVDGKAYHHLIDPDTLMPAEYCRSVTIFHPDSGFSDFLSTAVFLSPVEDGYKLIESIPDAEAFWIFEDGSTKYTPGFAPYLQSEGATNE